MQLRRAPNTRLSIAFAASVLVAVWAGVAWRLWFTDRVTFEGPLRQGSLRCADECHFDFVVEAYGGTRVRADTCIMPDTLRDWPGHPVHTMIAGTWEGERRLRASALFVKSNGWNGSKPSGGRPPSCFVPPAQR